MLVDVEEPEVLPIVVCSVELAVWVEMPPLNEMVPPPAEPPGEAGATLCFGFNVDGAENDPTVLFIMESTATLSVLLIP